MSELKIPILKKDAETTVSLTYSESAAIVQSIFELARHWTPEQVEDFKNKITNREKIEEPTQIVYLHLDRLYKKILKQAQEDGNVEYQDISLGADPLSKS